MHLANAAAPQSMRLSRLTPGGAGPESTLSKAVFEQGK